MDRGKGFKDKNNDIQSKPKRQKENNINSREKERKIIQSCPKTKLLKNKGTATCTQE